VVFAYKYTRTRGLPSKVRCSSKRQWLVANRGKRVAPICDRRGAADTESRSHGNVYILYTVYNLSVLPPPSGYCDLILTNKLKKKNNISEYYLYEGTSQNLYKSLNSHDRKHLIAYMSITRKFDKTASNKNIKNYFS